MRAALRRHARPAALTALAAIAHEIMAAEVASGEPFAALIAGRPGLALLALALLALRLALVVAAPAFWLRALALEAWRAWPRAGGRGRR